MILILVLFLIIIHIKFGLLTLIQISIWLIVFFSSNFLLGINPNEIKFKAIRILAVITILFIIFYESQINVVTTILFPFSLFQIDFRDSFEWKIKKTRDKHKISYLTIQTLTQDMISLLNSLKDDENYSMSLCFISRYNKWKDNKEENPPLLIDNAIIINKESDPILISQFIMTKLEDEGLFITNYSFKDSIINTIDPKILTVSIAIEVNI